MKRAKFNIIDILIVLLLIAVIVIVVTGVTAARKTAQAETPVTAAPIAGPPAEFAPNLRFEVVACGLEPELAEKIAAAEENRIYNGFQLCDAYIVSAVVEPSTVTDTSGDAARQIDDPAHRNVRFTVEAQLHASDYYTTISGNRNAYLGSQEVRLGKAYTLKTMTVEVLTTVTGLEWIADD